MMKTVLCLLVVIWSAQSRVLNPQENDISYKRFQLLKTPLGDEEVVDLLASEAPLIKADVSHMTYYLYTKRNLDSPHIVKSNNAHLLTGSQHFDPQKKTYFIIHGWVDSHSGALGTQITQALLKLHDVNIFVVDWSPVAAEGYSTASGSVTDIGKFVGEFVNKIIDMYGISGSSITLIGHSLGAHISGNAANFIKTRVEHIIGLDPAAPGFTVDKTADRLDPSDANYVQVIHTNGRFLGFSSSIGHADYYPNGGMTQAGCGLDLLGVCSHNRVIDYLAEAITGSGKYTATLCGNYNDFKNNKCNNNKKALMGSVNVDKNVVGDFFLNTNSAAPFAQG